MRADTTREETRAASKFDFLQPGWNDFHADATETEHNAFAAPRTAVFYARRPLELAVRWMYCNDRDLKAPSRRDSRQGSPS